MITIGITGGVGAGKSTVLEYLTDRWGGVCVQADRAGHLVMEPGGSCYEAVRSLFGGSVLGPDGRILRNEVAKVVFADEGMRVRLNAVIHPAVLDYILRRKEEERAAGTGLFVVEAALLLEAGYQSICDRVWTVKADRAVRIQRLTRSRGYSQERCLAVMDSQRPDAWYEERTDAVLINNGDTAELYRRIDALMSGTAADLPDRCFKKMTESE